MRSISCLTNSVGYNSDDNGKLQVPPPPPHIKLLNLGSYGHRQCIKHVISYLNNNSRKSTAILCIYLKDAVDERYAWLIVETHTAGECTPEAPMATPAENALIELKAPVELLVDELPMAVAASAAAKCCLDEQRQKE